MKNRVELNKEVIRDKILACWTGKNIGGTMGTPYEGKREILDVKGFATEKGTVLPNDDLDLQLVWLEAIEKYGPYNITPAVLTEYWIRSIPPFWNEYGTGKANIRTGILPPLSGELNNERWKNSNGAWIRSEIWACLAPGYPNIACKYAFMDACVDHGYSEGTYAEIFTAAIESYAFFESDIRKLLELAAAKIPPTSRINSSIKIVVDAYDRGDDWKTARNLVVEANRDLGWFQAPANIAFVVLGLLYGEGDFKQSMIYAINCGDDTDCTGATIGAIMGIINGTKGIPTDWSEHIGDNIVTVAVANGVSTTNVPGSCTELTDRVINMMPVVFKANGLEFEFTDGESQYECGQDAVREPKTYFDHKQYSYIGYDGMNEKCFIELDCAPNVRQNSDIQLKVRFENKIPEPRQLHINVYTPDGWSADYQKRAFLSHRKWGIEDIGDHYAEIDVTIHVGENVNSVNRCVLEVTMDGRAYTEFAPIVLLG
jgi:ADP-ribosylglycohydrolase